MEVTSGFGGSGYHEIHRIEYGWPFTYAITEIRGDGTVKSNEGLMQFSKVCTALNCVCVGIIGVSIWCRQVTRRLGVAVWYLRSTLAVLYVATIAFGISISRLEGSEEFGVGNELESQLCEVTFEVSSHAVLRLIGHVPGIETPQFDSWTIDHVVVPESANTHEVFSLLRKAKRPKSLDISRSIVDVEILNAFLRSYSGCNLKQFQSRETTYLGNTRSTSPCVRT